VDHVLRAFDRVWRSAPEGARPLFAYIGDGPFISDLEALRDSLPSRQDIRFLGYRTDAMALLAGADVCVSASVWQEAFGLAVLEPMSLGRAVVATSVGGVPEIVDDEVSGILVAPGDDAALAAAIERLLHDAPLRARLGVAARRRAAGFTLDSQIHALSALAGRAFERRSTAPVTPGVAEPRAHDGAT
jgi:glycosyltransferase involved in cell wall biosynthesis